MAQRRQSRPDRIMMASDKGQFGRKDLDGNLAGRDRSAVQDEDATRVAEHHQCIFVTSIADVLIVMGGVAVYGCRDREVLCRDREVFLHRFHKCSNNLAAKCLDGLDCDGRH